MNQIENSFTFLNLKMRLNNTQDKFPIFQNLFGRNRLYAKPFSLLLLQESDEEILVSLMDYLGTIEDPETINTFKNILVCLSHDSESELVRSQAFMTLQCWSSEKNTPIVKDHADNLDLTIKHIQLLLNECEINSKFVESLGFYLANVASEGEPRVLSKILLGLQRSAQAKEPGSSIKLQCFIDALAFIDPGNNIKSIIQILPSIQKSGLCDISHLLNSWEDGIKRRNENIKNNPQDIELVNKLRNIRGHDGQNGKQTVPLDLGKEIDLSEYV